MLFCLALAAYFGLHAVSGSHGLLKKWRLQASAAALEFELDGLKASRARLERDIVLLSSDPPHPDLVEEIARDVLGFVYPGDKIVRTKKPGER